MIGIAAAFGAAWLLLGERTSARGFWLCLGPALGGSTLLTYAWLWLDRPGLWGLRAIEGIALVAVGALVWRAPDPADAGGPVGPLLPRSLWVLVAAAGLSAAIGAVLTLREFPYGLWDAVEIWNMRAVSFLRAGLSEAYLSVRHADYPLLVPLVSTHLQVYAGETRFVAMGVSLAFGAAIVGTLGSVVASVAGRVPAAVAMVALLAAPRFAVNVASQRADIPLAAFMLGAAATLLLYDRTRRDALLWLAGVQLGCAAWTKNEGLLFVLVLLLAWGATSGRDSLARVWRIAGGALPFLLVLGLHKLTCGGATDLIRDQQGFPWDRLADPTRYTRIAVAVFREGAPYASVAAGIAWFLGVRRLASHPARFVLLASVLMLAGYLAVYLTTPRDLAWHLGSSLDRLLIQLWPLALLGLGAASAPPEPAETQNP